MCKKKIQIGSSDYSAELYTYDDVDNDTSLEHFSVEKDKDYTVSGDYSGTEVGTYTAIIEGTGNYKGRTEIDWNITVLKVTGILNLIQGDEGETAALSKVYDGSAEYEIENPEDYSVVFTTADDVTSEYRLDENCRITVTFEDANAGTEKDYEYSIEFSDEMAASFGITAPMTGVPSERNGTIYPKELSSVTVILEDVQFTYTGSVIEPSLTVKEGSAVIPADQYEVSYTDNTNVGTATITVKAKDGSGKKATLYFGVN